MYKKNASTLVEVLIVIVILGLLVGIASVSVMKSKGGAEKDACRANMAMIEATIDQWAMDQIKLGSTDITSSASMYGAGSDPGWVSYIKGGLPSCTQGGAYTYGGGTLDIYTVTCGVSDHNNP